jgi:hypothetical protein
MAGITVISGLSDRSEMLVLLEAGKYYTKAEIE